MKINKSITDIIKRFYYTVINSKVELFGRLLLIILTSFLIVLMSLIFECNIFESTFKTLILFLVCSFIMVLFWAFISFLINFTYWTFTEKSIFEKIYSFPKKVLYVIYKLIFGNWEKNIFLKEKDNGKE